MLLRPFFASSFLAFLLALGTSASRAADECSLDDMNGIASRRHAAASAHEPGAVAGHERDVERFVEKSTPVEAATTIPGLTPDLAADLGRLHAEGATIPKAAPGRAITTDLRHAPISSVRQASGEEGRLGRYVVVLDTKDSVTGASHRLEAYFKPRTWGDEGGRARTPMETLAYELNRKLGMDYVLPSAYRRGLHVEIDGKVFTEGAFVLKPPDFHEFTAASAEKFAASHEAVIADNRVLNVLMHNPEGHAWNLGTTRHWGDGKEHPVFVNWGASLHPDTHVTLTEYHAVGNSSVVDSVSQKTFDALQRLTAEDFRELVKDDILTNEEVRQLLSRRDGIVAYFKGIEKLELETVGAHDGAMVGGALKAHAEEERRAFLIDNFRKGARSYDSADALARRIAALPPAEQLRWRKTIGALYRQMPKEATPENMLATVFGRRLMDRAYTLIARPDEAFGELRKSREAAEAFREEVSAQAAVFGANYDGEEVMGIVHLARDFIRDYKRDPMKENPFTSIILGGSFINGKARLGTSDIDISVHGNPNLAAKLGPLQESINNFLASRGKGKLAIETDSNPPAFFGQLNTFAVKIDKEGATLLVFPPSRVSSMNPSKFDSAQPLSFPLTLPMDSHLAKPGRALSQAELVTAAVERAPPESQFVPLAGTDRRPVKMIRMSDLGFPREQAVQIETVHGGTQLKPAGSDGYLAFDDAKKGYFLVAADAEGNPSGHVPRDPSVSIATSAPRADRGKVMAAAASFHESATRELASARERYFAGKGSFRELEEANLKFGHLETFVTGDGEDSRRIGYLSQEESYLARQAADAQPDKAAEIESRRVAIAAQLANERGKRAALLAAASDGDQSSVHARRGVIGSLTSDDGFARYQSHFPGRSFHEVSEDPVESRLLAALKKKELMAADRKSHFDVPVLSDEETATAQLYSPQVREAILGAELANADGKTAGEVKALVVAVSPGKQPESVVADLKAQKATLQSGADRVSMRLFSVPEDPASLRARAELKAAQAALDDRIGLVARNDALLKEARSLTEAEVAETDAAVKSVMKFLADSDAASLAKINPALADAASKGISAGEARLEKYLEFKRIVGDLAAADRAAVFSAVRDATEAGKPVAHFGGSIADGEAIAKAFRRSDELSQAVGAADVKVTRAVYRDAKLSPAEQALADAIGASRTPATSSVERHAVAAAETKKIEAELKSATRAPASLAAVPELAKRELAGTAGLNDAKRAALAGAVVVIEKTPEDAKAALDHLNALAKNPDVFETYRMAYQAAGEELAANPKLAKKDAWEAGVRKMLLDSGYSEEEIRRGDLVKKTAACLPM